LPKEFEKTKIIVALEKLIPKDLSDLESDKIVTASEEIVMKFAFMEFEAGEVNVLLINETAMKLMLVIIELPPPDVSVCAGKALKVSDASSGMVVKCDSLGTSADNDCDMAFSEGNYWESKDNPSLISQEYKNLLMPKKLIYKPNPKAEKSK